jgi:hypothetical protein
MADDEFLPTRPGTQVSVEVQVPGRTPGTWWRHVWRHWALHRTAWCPWCPKPSLTYLGRPDGRERP